MKKLIMLFMVLAMLALPVVARADTAWVDWDSGTVRTMTQRARGNSATFTFLTATAVVTDGAGSVGIASANHGFYTDAQVVISGTTNYDGTHTITAVQASSFTMLHKYTAETLGAADTVAVSIKPNQEWQYLGYRLRTATAPSTAGQLSITLDSGTASDFDLDIDDEAMLNTRSLFKSYDYTATTYFSSGDEVDFKWSNVDGVVWAIELKYRILSPRKR